MYRSHAVFHYRYDYGNQFRKNSLLLYLSAPDLSEKKSEFIPNNLVFTTSGVLHGSWSVGPTPGFDVMPLFLS